MTSSDVSGPSGSVVEIEFWTEDQSYPLVDLSGHLDCKIVLEQLMPGKNSGYYCYYEISGVSPSEVRNLLQGYEGLDARLVSSSDNSGLFEVRIEDGEQYFAPLLTEAGAYLSQVWSENGEVHLLVEVPATTSPSDIIEQVVQKHPTVEVIARRQKDYEMPLFSQEQFREAVNNELTERQREVLFAAFTGGYFESPRRKSGEAIADELGIAPPTFSQHLRAAQLQVFSLLF